MAEEHVDESRTEDTGGQSNGNGQSNGHNIGRVAAVAAATGATAYAARKALQSRSSGQSGDEERPRKKSSSGGGSGGSSAALVSTAVASGWDVAKDSLTPIVADAASKAGAYVAERAPDVVRDVVVPRFIAGFEKAKRGKRGDDESED